MLEEKIEIIYRMVLNDLVLNDKALKESGFTDEEIDCLLIQNVLAYKNDNTYKLVKVDKLRHYGVQLLFKKETRDANRCFRKCYELDPNGRDICLQYMLAAVIRRDYETVFEVFANLEKIHPTKNAVNNNLYLYLLSFLTKCPDEYAKNVRDADFILVGTYGNKPENDIRFAILKGKFKYAYKKLNEFTAKLNNYSVKFELLRNLLSQVIDSEEEFKKELLDYAKNGEYRKIVAELKERESQRYLSNYWSHVLIIANAILDVLENKIIPISSINMTFDLYHALIGNNFKLAYEINKEFLDFTKANKDKDIINILLLKLNELITDLKEDYVGVVKNYNEVDSDILDAKALVEDVINRGITIDEARKKMGLKLEVVLLMKLIYVRDYCYVSDSEEKRKEADLILQEVELCDKKSNKVICLLNEIKAINNNPKKRILSN